MTIYVDESEVTKRIGELLDRVKAGDEILISRGAQVIARLAQPEVTAASLGDVNERAFEALRRARAGIGPVSIDEILAWRDEGRR